MVRLVFFNFLFPKRIRAKLDPIPTMNDFRDNSLVKHIIIKRYYISGFITKIIICDETLWSSQYRLWLLGGCI
jgi:hypothetical protein